MNNNPIKIRPSGALSFDECGFAYYLKYVLGIKQAAVSANLPFGTAIHEAFTGYVLASFNKDGSFDPVKTFLAHWENSLDTVPIEFTSTFGEDDLTATGTRIAELIPDFWDSTGLFPLVDSQGPVVERRFEIMVAPGVILSGQPDVIAMDEDFNVIPLDFKTSAVDYPEEFLYASDQLTDYQLLVEGHGDQLGVDKESIAYVGFIEALKKKMPKTTRGKGPEILPPLLGPKRNEQRLAERRQKLAWMADDIRRGRFPKKPRMAYNSPCALCEFSGLCLKGDKTGLTIPDEAQQIIAIAA